VATAIAAAALAFVWHVFESLASLAPHSTQRISIRKEHSYGICRRCKDALKLGSIKGNKTFDEKYTN